jgi:probable phosphoglycerate mutase
MAVRANGGLAPDASDLIVDERLREKKFGILDRVTRLGIEQRHPELADARGPIEKLLQTPGRRKLVRLILRLRSVLDTTAGNAC